MEIKYQKNSDSLVYYKSFMSTGPVTKWKTSHNYRTRADLKSALFPSRFRQYCVWLFIVTHAYITDKDFHKID